MSRDEARGPQKKIKKEINGCDAGKLVSGREWHSPVILKFTTAPPPMESGSASVKIV